MATRTHCDRCDRSPAISDHATEISGTILQDYGHYGDGVSPLRIEARAVIFTGHTWQPVNLCPNCYLTVIGATYDMLRRERG